MAGWGPSTGINGFAAPLNGRETSQAVLQWAPMQRAESRDEGTVPGPSDPSQQPGYQDALASCEKQVGTATPVDQAVPAGADLLMTAYHHATDMDGQLNSYRDGYGSCLAGRGYPDMTGYTDV